MWNILKGVIILIVVNARYFPEIGVHMLNGYTTNLNYSAAYNEVLKTVQTISSTANIESISFVKCIESNETGLTFGGFHVSVKFKE